MNQQIIQKQLYFTTSNLNEKDDIRVISNTLNCNKITITDVLESSEAAASAGSRQPE